MPKSFSFPDISTSSSLAYAMLFGIGFVTVSIQFIFLRQISPFFGNSAPIVSVVISMFLAALAIGVKKGGETTSHHAFYLKRNLFASALFLGIGGSYIAAHKFFTVLLSSSFDQPIIILSAFLLLAMFPAVYMLEQSVPLLINFIGKGRHAKLAGNAFKVATWGNILGGAFTALFVLHYFGVGWAVFVNSLVLITLFVLLSKGAVLSIIAAIVALAPIYGANVLTEKILFTKTTEYANYLIIDNDEGLKLVSNLSFSSRKDPDGSISPYAEFIRKSLFDDLKLEGEEILILGAGGFSFSEFNHGNNILTYIDIDRQIKPLIEEHFLKEKIDDVFIPQDARAFLNKSGSRKWKAIVVDVFSGMNSIPQSLLTVEFFKLLKQHIETDGYILFNFLMKQDFSREYSRGFDNTLRTYFPSCLASPVSQTNVVYVCANRD